MHENWAFGREGPAKKNFTLFRLQISTYVHSRNLIQIYNSYMCVSHGKIGINPCPIIFRISTQIPPEYLDTNSSHSSKCDMLNCDSVSILKY